MKRLVLTVAILLGLAAPAWAGFAEGVAAYKRGDYVTALRELRPLAEQGDARAQSNLGVMYSHGHGVQQDYSEAVKWYRKAAEQGYAGAQADLGVMYYRGEGVLKNYDAAAKWIRKAAEQGLAASQSNLGFLYRMGDGVPKNYATAAKWYRKAAEQDFAGAQHALGQMYYRLGENYYRGQGVPQNFAAALKWYRKAANQGNAKAQKALGEIYSQGKGVPKDYVQAHKWLNLYASNLPPGPGLAQIRARVKRDTLAERMTPAQIAKAQRLAQEWVENRTPWKDDPLVYLPPKALLAKIQRGLAALGYDPGPADGIYGRKTSNAIEAFQADNALPATGDDWELLGKQVAAAIKSRPKSRPKSLKKHATGSGFVVSQEGHVLTNLHVVEGCRTLRIEQPELASRSETNTLWAERQRRLKFIGADKQTDLALLKLYGSQPKRNLYRKFPSPASFRAGRGIRAGDSVVAVGFPLQGLLTSDPSVTTGAVSALAGPGDDRRLLQITTPVQPGNSGGPLLDLSGNIVGVVVGKLNALKVALLTGDIPQNVNFAISTGAVRTFLDAHSVPYKTAPSSRTLSPADVAAQARKFTVLIECRK